MHMKKVSFVDPWKTTLFDITSSKQVKQSFRCAYHKGIQGGAEVQLH